MQCFETLYDVPVTHRLVPVRSRSLGGRIPATYWEHEEYDALGRLIARYESFTESGARVGGARSGWRKYNAASHLVQQGTSLPFGGEMGLRGGGDRFGMLQTKLVSRASVQVDQDVFDRSCWPFCPLAH